MRWWHSLVLCAQCAARIAAGGESAALDCHDGESDHFRPPNVVVIITDDQGYGDLSFYGNPYFRTPNLDKLARESVRFSHFYVSPVCSPTRASLLTGRYNYRTGVVDTYLGRSMMFGDEVTLAEVMHASGYRTGIFGKWHLGDNYPMRPIDQGFEEALVHKGGGIGQPSDPPGGESYFNPILQHNGRAQRRRGYCSDIFAEAAIEFMKGHRAEPFLVWLAFNAPHTPLEVPKKYLAGVDRSVRGTNAARVYAMVSNVDENVGRLLHEMEKLKLQTNTIVIFLTDNGPASARYNANLRGLKGSVYEGGIRVPFFVRWPGVLAADREIKEIAAHIDLMPTILDACGIASRDMKFDGQSLLPLLREDAKRWRERTLFFQWHRGDEPELYRSCAARTQHYKLVQLAPSAKPQLFDMKHDPFEQHNVASEQGEVRDRLLKQYERWFEDVTSTRKGERPRIIIGTPNENPTILTRQDWTGPTAGWNENSVGYWRVEVAEAKPYTVTARFKKLSSACVLHFRFQDVHWQQDAKGGVSSVTFARGSLPAGAGELHCWIESGGRTNGVNFVEIRQF